jgi:hypothetical protein
MGRVDVARVVVCDDPRAIIDKIDIVQITIMEAAPNGGSRREHS